MAGRIKTSSTSHFIHQLASEPNNAVHFPWGSVKYHRSTVAAEYRRSPSALPSFVIYLRDSFDVERATPLEFASTEWWTTFLAIEHSSFAYRSLHFSLFFFLFSFFFFFFSALAKRLIRLETRNIERCRRTRKWLISGAWLVSA